MSYKHGEIYSIDSYAYASNIRLWKADFKVYLSLITLILCIILNNMYVSIVIIFSMGYVTIKKGGINFKDYLSVITIPLTFILISTFTIAIDVSWKSIGEYNLFLGFFYVNTSKVAIYKMFLLILKIFGAISALQMMTLSTPAIEIIYVFRKMHLPKIILELMSLIYRYIFILFELSTKMKNSAKSREGYCDFKTSCHTFGSIASNILVVSLKRANAYYDAMEARCYDGEFFILEEDGVVKNSHIIISGIFIVILILIWKISN